MRRRAEIVVNGQVQGVFFRASAKEEAEKLGLVGWAKNEPDGSVKIVAEGEEEGLKKLVEWVKLGTKFSRIDKVEVEWGEAESGFLGFEIK